MKLPENRLKQRLSRGEVTYGLWAGLPDSSCAEICAAAGFDWIVIDAEHGPFDNPAILRYLQTLAGYDLPAVVRPPSDDRNLIKQILDLGAQTLLVPMIETAEQASELVLSMYYPPRGVRGLGTSLARAARWNQVPDYVHRANEEICLMVQVETRKAVENLKEILQVDGVHGVFIGPSDLSASMGHVGEPAHPEVVATIRQALSEIRAADRFAGLLCTDPAMVDEFIEAGAGFIGVGVDTLLLGNTARHLARQYTGKTNDPDGHDEPGY